MNRLRLTLFICLLAFIMLPTAVFAQSKDNSIEASWNRASTPSVQKPRVQHPAPVPVPESDGLEYDKTTWDATRSHASRPWPKMTATSTVKEYFDANNVVIDSLSRLYCISTNYISTLRIRNQQAMQGRGTQLRDFNYEGDQPPLPASSDRASMQALYKELIQLLERCLVGR